MPEKKEAEKTKEIPAKAEPKITSLAEAKAYGEWRERVPRAARQIVEGGLKGSTPKFTPTGLANVDGFLSGLAQEIAQPEKQKKTSASYLRAIEQEEGGSLDALAYVMNPKTSFADRLKIWESHIEPVLDYYRALDLEPPEKTEIEQEETKEAAEKESETPSEDDVPPPPDGSIAPTMDEMEKNEGEPKMQYRVSPFWGGYYAEQRCAEWDAKTLAWRGVKRSGSVVRAEKIDALAARKMVGRARAGQPLAIPLPPGWGVDPKTLKLPPGFTAIFRRSADGSMAMEMRGQGTMEYGLTIGPAQRPYQAPASENKEIATEKPRLPKELKQLVDEIKASNVGSAAKARLVAKAVRERLEYSNDSSFNARYRQDTSGYVERVWDAKQADCDVANTVALFALQELGIGARIVSGHYVKSKSKDGSAGLHSGTRHAWLEIWDDGAERWILADATPKGDPTLDEERPDEQAESCEGDYGEKEAELMSDEDFQELIKKLEKAEKKEIEKPKTDEQQMDADFAAEAGCAPEEAAQVRRAFERVRDLRDAAGERIGEKLMREWRKLVTDRVAKTTGYRGPVRMSEGDELLDPAETVIDVKSGQRDPGGFEKIHPIEKKEQLFGGLDIYLMLDLSGSMSERDPATGQIKADLQRDFAMLYADTIMSCSFHSRQAERDLDAPLPVRLQIVSIHGGASVDLPLCDRWEPKEQLALYKSAHAYPSGGTPDDKGLALIGQRIVAERETWKKHHHPAHLKPPIEFVAVCLDGGSDEPETAHNLANQLRSSGSVVYAYGMTAAARAVEAIYAPHAKVLEGLEEQAQILAQDTIDVFRKMYPQRVKLKA